MKKRIVSIFLLLLLTACGAATASNSMPEESPGNTYVPPDIQVQSGGDYSIASIRYITFEEALQEAQYIVIARCKGRIDYGSYIEFEFDVRQNIKGIIEEDTIYLYEPKNIWYVVEETDIEYTDENTYFYEDYLLILEKQISVYWEHDRYMTYPTVWVPYRDFAFGTYHGEPLPIDESIETPEQLVDFVLAVIESADPGVSEDFAPPFTRSTRWEDILEVTTCIAVVEVLEFDKAVPQNHTEIYYCNIEQMLMGPINYHGQGPTDTSAKIVFFENTLMVGDRCVVLLSIPEEKPGTDIYRLSSPSSVIDIRDTESIEAVRALIS